MDGSKNFDNIISTTSDTRITQQQTPGYQRALLMKVGVMYPKPTITLQQSRETACPHVHDKDLLQSCI